MPLQDPPIPPLFPLSRRRASDRSHRRRCFDRQMGRLSGQWQRERICLLSSAGRVMGSIWLGGTTVMTIRYPIGGFRTRTLSGACRFATRSLRRPSIYLVSHTPAGAAHDRPAQQGHVGRPPWRQRHLHSARRDTAKLCALQWDCTQGCKVYEDMGCARLLGQVGLGKRIVPMCKLAKGRAELGETVTSQPPVGKAPARRPQPTSESVLPGRPGISGRQRSGGGLGFQWHLGYLGSLAHQTIVTVAVQIVK